MSTAKMRIWDQVQTTDPAYTTKVEFGRKFTSIDAMWQIKRMTEQFGPIGLGWGYRTQHSIERLADTMILAVCDVTIWWNETPDRILSGLKTPSSENSYGPIRGATEIWSPGKSGAMRVDEDAPKKSMTDALTKGLSHLGLSADVFLGLFDDNRYVTKITRDFAARAAEKTAPIPLPVQMVLTKLKEAQTSEARKELWLKSKLGLEGVSQAYIDLLILKFKEAEAKDAAAHIAAE